MKPESQELTLTQPQTPTVAAMIQGALQHNITPDTASVIERLCALKEREDAKNAERAFAAAFVKLQAAIPKIEPSRGIPDKHGNVKFRYAPYEEIMRKVRPLLLEHGFTITFDNDFADGRVIVTCKLQHTDGHKTETKHAARIGSGPVNSSEAQADGAAQTYAKRFALCSALNIVIEHDTDAQDARNIGGPVTQKQADTLRDLCDDTKADRKKFLALCEVETFEEIPANRYEDLKATLERRRK